MTDQDLYDAVQARLVQREAEAQAAVDAVTGPAKKAAQRRLVAWQKAHRDLNAVVLKLQLTLGADFSTTAAVPKPPAQ